MSGDSFKPEDGGGVEAINPDLGNTEIDAQPESGDAMDAAELEAAKEFTSVDDEAKDEEIEQEQVEEDLQAEPDETVDPETQVDEPEASVPVEWDGNPETLPEELQPTYKQMLRGFHSKTKELADARRATEDLQAKLLLKVSDGPVQEPKVEQPPPLPTGENISQEQWNEAVTNQTAWYAEQNRQSMLKELETSDKFVSADQFASVQQQADTRQLETEIRALPGFSPEVENLMVQRAKESEFWATALGSREGAFELANQAIAEASSRQTETAAATAATAKAQKQSTAATRATPRVTTPKGATPEDVFATKGFQSEDARMEEAERLVREQYGG